jgi:hypothetical protein
MVRNILESNRIKTNASSTVTVDEFKWRQILMQPKILKYKEESYFSPPQVYL